MVVGVAVFLSGIAEVFLPRATQVLFFSRAGVVVFLRSLLPGVLDKAVLAAFL